ncbi:MAG: UDP-N-acetylglucosamine 1-carboxyvinyltransferase [Candidatus Buchananbacteria bacterium RIFCSPHIGHO2_02_FULL_56_16]|uniref:UDP-N-acetylglucosamine 1-carboxyvinyltransferase n=1 Tax=Candidatus Buchananbacteria bacterium RIFCSPHIGHO2_02_FULL_56_16 TaxID=1797542 RepID=A0A1G1YDN7_9BACT|nr:MAG: UDP-N-acetylglucosamine 1-carboxyvinyltransferase [Candidatus Buchananbacteria bacterium RIFCSPHIGHO2_02_FULL_56_16]
MSSFQIDGGRRLSGTVTTNASKNAAVVLMNAALLNRGVTTLKNVPRIEEVNRIIEVLQSIGVGIRWSGQSSLILTPPRQLTPDAINYRSAIQTRSVLFLLPVLAHRHQSFRVPQPGGCRLGKRTVRPHLYALEQFGISIRTSRKHYQVTARELRPGPNVVLYESGDTVTENAIMAAALIPGTTVIKFASANYQVVDLCHFLTKLGVKITGIGSTTLKIEGRRLINQSVSYSITEDPIETMLFLAAAAVTRSTITIRRCPIDFLELELLKLEKMGFRYKVIKRYLAHNGVTALVDLKTSPSNLTALEEKIYARPFPGINIDNLPFFVPIATQAKGTTLIFDWVYENRAIYYTELSKLGANITLADPHRVYIAGPTTLRANEIICPPALRPSSIILVAMLAAKGRSLLRNIYSIERGYEDLCGRLGSLGAKIKKIES